MKIKFRGYKLSRMLEIFGNFSYFDAIFSDFLIDISRLHMKVPFRGYKLSREPKKLAKSRNFLPVKLTTFKVVEDSADKYGNDYDIKQCVKYWGRARSSWARSGRARLFFIYFLFFFVFLLDF